MVLEGIGTESKNGKFVAKPPKCPRNIEKICCKMKVKGTYKYEYLALNLRAKVVVRFRKFSKKIAHTHSDALIAMLDFFEWHNYSPNQRFAKDLGAGQEVNRKRIEAGIAISKSIEKAQNIPLTNIETMLRSLFEEEQKMHPPKLLEAKKPTLDKSKIEKEKTTVSRIKYDRTNRKLKETKDRLAYVLEKVEPVSTRFGKDFLKVEITTEELARFKQALKD